MDASDTKQQSSAWRIAAAAVAPFVVASSYLFFSRWPSYRFTGLSDTIGLGVSLLAGAAFIAIMRISIQKRIACLLVYLPVFAALLFYYTFLFIAIVFHDGL